MKTKNLLRGTKLPVTDCDNTRPEEQARVRWPSGEMSGCFDRFSNNCAVGWVARRGSPQRLDVEVVADGEVVARGVADNFRSDLVTAGIGDGKHGFNIPLPPSLMDSREHRIEVRELTTGHLLAGSPQKYLVDFPHHAQLRLDGGALAGTVVLSSSPGQLLELQVLENGSVIARGEASSDPHSNVLTFYLALPTEVFDGRPHIFTVQSEDLRRTFGQLAIITPIMLTPEHALQRYAREGLKPSLAVASGYRYESFVKAVDSALRADTSDKLQARLEQLLRVHRRVVEGTQDADRNFEPLNFVPVGNPKVSVVIPVHNKFGVTYHCLCSLLLASNEASFEVIVVDDGSTDLSVEIPRLVSGITYVRNDESQGFVRACNLGASHARGDYVVMLNNDTEVSANWLDELIWPFHHFTRVGMTGAKLIYPDGTLQEAGGIVWNTGDPWNYGRGGNQHDPRYGYTRQVDYLSGACMMLPVWLWNELEGFDEAFVPAYFEDTDLGFRVRACGYKTVYTPFSKIIHYEGASNGTDVTSGVKRHQEQNRPTFKKRWAAAYRGNGKVGEDVDINKDRNVSFRALVLDAEVPMPDQNAGSYAAIQEMRMLQALGFKCTFVPMNMAWLGHYTEALQRMGVECVYAPFASSIGDVLQQRGSEFDLVYVTRYTVAKDYIGLVRKYAPQARLIMNNADLHFLRELRAGLEAGSEEIIRRSIDTRDAELATMRDVDLVLSYSEVEKAVILSHNLNSSKVELCPWSTEVVDDVPKFQERIDLAFLGGYRHHPNVEAVEWFLRNVMPRLRDVLPGVRFLIYGSNVPDSLIELASEQKDVVVKGWVPSVHLVYNSCRIFVAPLQSGAGIKGKVIGALAYGVPCVISPIAAEGLGLRNHLEASIAQRADEWVAEIVRIYSSEELWMNMSSQARRFALQQFGFGQAVGRMQQCLEGVGVFADVGDETLALIP